MQLEREAAAVAVQQKQQQMLLYCDCCWQLHVGYYYGYKSCTQHIVVIATAVYEAIHIAEQSHSELKLYRMVLLRDVPLLLHLYV
jgi:hypothetical protein